MEGVGNPESLVGSRPRSCSDSVNCYAQIYSPNPCMGSLYKSARRGNLEAQTNFIVQNFLKLSSAPTDYRRCSASIDDSSDHLSSDCSQSPTTTANNARCYARPSASSTCSEHFREVQSPKDRCRDQRWSSHGRSVSPEGCDSWRKKSLLDGVTREDLREVFLEQLLRVSQDMDTVIHKEMSGALGGLKGSKMTFSSFATAARSLLGNTKWNPGKVWAVIGFSRQISQQMPRVAEDVSNFTSQLLNSEALDCIEERGGWGVLLQGPDLDEVLDQPSHLQVPGLPEVSRCSIDSELSLSQHGLETKSHGPCMATNNRVCPSPFRCSNGSGPYRPGTRGSIDSMLSSPPPVRKQGSANSLRSHPEDSRSRLLASSSQSRSMEQDEEGSDTIDPAFLLAEEWTQLLEELALYNG